MSDKIKIQKVNFLVPANVYCNINGEDTNLVVSVDLANRKVFNSSGEEILKEEFFEYLDEVNTLPEDFFAASGDLEEETKAVNEERQKIYRMSK